MEPDALAAQVLELGCDAVSVAVVYHRGRRVFPRHRRVSVLTRTTMYVEPERARYGALVPEGTRTEPSAAVPRGVRTERAAVPGVGRRAPQRRARGRIPGRGGAAARRLAGRPQPLPVRSRGSRVRRRAGGRRRRAARARSTSTSRRAFYPAWEPSYTLTLALDPLSESARLLAPQCFCVSCRALLGPAVEARVHAAAGPPFADAAAGAEDVPADLAAGRAAGAARLVEAAAETVHAAGSSLRVFVSGPPEQAALQGVSPISVDRRRRTPLRLRPARGRRVAAPLHRAARACREHRLGLDELDARPHGARGRCRAARSRRCRGPRALQPHPRPGSGTRLHSGRLRTPSAQARPHDGGRRPRHARPREGRVSDCRGAARDDGPARNRAGARLAGRGVPAGAEPGRERARRGGCRLVGRAAARLRGRDAVARCRGARGAEAGAGCRSSRAQARLCSSGLRPARRSGRAARCVRGRLRLARLRPHGHAAARTPPPARVARGALP